MKQNVSPGVIIGIVAVIVLIIGFFAYRTFFKDPNATSLTDMKEYEAARARSAIHQNMNNTGANQPASRGMHSKPVSGQ